ncbi:hypothetical protein [Roseovarius indicus]|uniref:Uncharacterized protein n=1 Tax=Roseovarius indicus TaxID=540747 RepID=A0A0T5P3I1_9RHOB|nr:hypothetical protein [Roseovarius indicus]KRS15644.1 hypothetical protein XM52_22650 [Roseovarius indicus]QEW27848.1 hypothetical protein RIdsm_03669 [Roseovarius indicus]SFE79311.1 hypothetical protein SAMN04488031_12218 [Roseovarius indicus]
MADIEVSWDALMTPTDHALAHALSIHLLSIAPEEGWETVLRDTMEKCVTEPRNIIHPHALALRKAADRILKTTPGSGPHLRVTHDARQQLITFHKWRMGLSLERRSTIHQEKIAADS